jgi:hypothetical protein
VELGGSQLVEDLTAEFWDFVAFFLASFLELLHHGCPRHPSKFEPDCRASALGTGCHLV